MDDCGGCVYVIMDCLLPKIGTLNPFRNSGRESSVAMCACQ